MMYLVQKSSVGAVDQTEVGPSKASVSIELLDDNGEKVVDDKGKDVVDADGGAPLTRKRACGDDYLPWGSTSHHGNECVGGGTLTRLV